MSGVSLGEGGGSFERIPTPIGRLSGAYRAPIGRLQSAYLAPIGRLLNAYRAPIGRPAVANTMEHFVFYRF